MQPHFLIHIFLDHMVQGMSMGVVQKKEKTSLHYTAGPEHTTKYHKTFLSGLEKETRGNVGAPGI